MQTRFTKIGILAIAFLVVLSTVAFGQGVVSGTISGVVQDQQGAVISGAKITAKELSTNSEFKTESNASGNFRLAGLPGGSYSVTIEAPKFAKIQRNNVVVNANRETPLGAIGMKIGAESEVVNVEGSAPLIETTTSQITKSFDSRQAAELPLGAGGTAFDSLALLIPGVTSAQDAGFSNSNGADLSVNGQRGRSNNFQIDGQSNNDNSVAGPQYFVNNADLIAEFQVVTNNFSAEYGRNMGSVVNYVTKTGTNSFHGTGFEFYTGNWADARVNQEKNTVFGYCAPGMAPGTGTDFAPFDPLSGQYGCGVDPDPLTNIPTKGAPDIPRYVDNRFGGTLGGPIWKDKAWFFGSYVMQRIRAKQTPSQSGSSITPTPAGLAALQSAFPGNPAVAQINTYGPFAIPDGSPTIVGTPTTLLVSDGVGAAVPIEFSALSRSLPALTNDQQWTVRGDWQITDKDRFFARYLREDTDNTNASGTGWTGAIVDVPAVTNQIGLDYTRLWTNNYTMQLRVSYSRADVGFEGGPLHCAKMTLTDCASRVTFSGAGTNASFGQATNLPQGRLVNNTQYQGNNIWVKGRHNLKFGGEYSRQRSPNVFLPSINGNFTFRGSGSAASPTTNAQCARFVGITAGSTACGFSNFLANTPNQLQLADSPSNGSYSFKEQDVAFYFQDDWRIKDNLTLNLGLRWEWNQQAINLLHELTVAQQTGSSPFWDTTLPLDLTTLPAIPEDRNNFGPNIGFAYTPRFAKALFGEDKTVIRGGFRVAYDPAFYNMFLNVATAAPVVNLGTVTNTGNPTAGFAPGVPSVGTGTGLRDAGYLAFIPVGGNPGGRSQTRVSPDFHNPYAEQWSLGVQRSITSNIAYEIRYVGNHTVGNFQTINANPRIDGLAADFPNLIPNGITPCTTVGAVGIGRVDCNRTLVRLRDNSSFSNYHALQQEIRLQSFHGLSMTFSHTWSKAIDNISEIFSTAAGGNGVAGSQNPFDPTVAERGVSGTSYPHTLSAYWIYDLPLYKNQSGMMGHLLGGWQVSGTWRWDSGQPFNPIQGTANSYCDATFNATFYGLDSCRPIVSNLNAAAGSAGFCSDSTLADCGLTDFNTGNPTTPDAVQFIYSDDEAALFIGTPFGGIGRNTFRGQSYNQTNLGIIKTTKINERMTFKLQANVQNAFNRQFRGVPDPILDDGQFDPANGLTQGSFMNNYFNASGAQSRRRLTLGAKIVF